METPLLLLKQFCRMQNDLGRTRGKTGGLRGELGLITPQLWLACSNGERRRLDCLLRVCRRKTFALCGSQKAPILHVQEAEYKTYHQSIYEYKPALLALPIGNHEATQQHLTALCQAPPMHHAGVLLGSPPPDCGRGCPLLTESLLGELFF